MSDDRADIDAHIMKLCETYLPVEEADDNDLRQLIQYSKWFTNKATGNLVANMAKTEIVLRAQRKAEAPTFQKGDTVEVIEELRWWPTASALMPMPGLRGEVIASGMDPNDRYLGGRNTEDDFVGLVPVRFRADELGYDWDKDDDPDREFVIYNMPNYSLSKRDS